MGGLLESMSMWTGIRSLLILAAALYLASWIALRRSAKSAAAPRHEDSLTAARRIA